VLQVSEVEDVECSFNPDTLPEESESVLKRRDFTIMPLAIMTATGSSIYASCPRKLPFFQIKLLLHVTMQTCSLYLHNTADHL
jgi:hypothetical protein